MSGGGGGGGGILVLPASGRRRKHQDFGCQDCKKKDSRNLKKDSGRKTWIRVPSIHVGACRGSEWIRDSGRDRGGEGVAEVRG